VSLADPYADFLTRKSVAIPPAGLTKVPTLHPALFEFQRAIVRRHLQLGRAAIFAGTGLGKTLMQLAWADAVERSAGGPVLILTPLAVAQQTVPRPSEVRHRRAFAMRAIRRGGPDRRHQLRPGFDRFDPDKFAAIVLDESSIIKAHDSKTRIGLTEAFAAAVQAALHRDAGAERLDRARQPRRVPGRRRRRRCCRPISSMTARSGPARRRRDGWRLKRHAAGRVLGLGGVVGTMLRHPGISASTSRATTCRRWSTCIRSRPGRLQPGDQRPVPDGCADAAGAASRRAATASASGLPPRPRSSTRRRTGPGWSGAGSTPRLRRWSRRSPARSRCAGSDHPNTEGRAAARLLRWRPRVLVTKPSIAGFGMNWQHCSDMVFVGLNDSFEQLYQAIRRCWRFGQTQPVNVYMSRPSWRARSSPTSRRRSVTTRPWPRRWRSICAT
jgi:hypothetical protein